MADSSLMCPDICVDPDEVREALPRAWRTSAPSGGKARVVRKAQVPGRARRPAKADLADGHEDEAVRGSDRCRAVPGTAPSRSSVSPATPVGTRRQRHAGTSVPGFSNVVRSGFCARVPLSLKRTLSREARFELRANRPERCLLTNLRQSRSIPARAIWMNFRADSATQNQPVRRSGPSLQATG